MALSTIGTAAIADDAITSAKVDSTTAAFTVADLVVTNGITAGTSINAGTELVGNLSRRILMDASAAGTDAGDEFLLNATDGSASNDGSKILFEEGTYGQNLTEGVGSVLQVQQGFITSQMSSTSTTYVTTGLIVKITPKFSNSKILLFCSYWAGYPSQNRSNTYTLFRDERDMQLEISNDQTAQGNGGSGHNGMTQVGDSTGDGNMTYHGMDQNIIAVDSTHQSTSELTYSLRGRVDGATWYFNRNQNNDGNSARLCTFVAMEVKQ